MIHGGMQIYSQETNDWEWAQPYVYNGAEWKHTVGYVNKDNTWKMIGGAGIPLVYFLDADGKYMVDSNGGYILVRRSYAHYFIDSNGNYLCDSEGKRLTAED